MDTDADTDTGAEAGDCGTQKRHEHASEMAIQSINSSPSAAVPLVLCPPETPWIRPLGATGLARSQWPLPMTGGRLDSHAGRPLRVISCLGRGFLPVGLRLRACSKPRTGRWTVGESLRKTPCIMSVRGGWNREWKM